MYMITNGHGQMQRRKIEITGLHQFMNNIFVAQETGFSKPSPEIYQFALQAAEVEPGEALMVGDHPEKDILGAKALGIRTAWMRRHDSYRQYHDPQPDYYVENMYDVQELVEQSNGKMETSSPVEFQQS